MKDDQILGIILSTLGIIGISASGLDFSNISAETNVFFAISFLLFSGGLYLTLRRL